MSEKIGQLKLKASDGKEYLTDCANTEILFRIIQPIPIRKKQIRAVKIGQWKIQPKDLEAFIKMRRNY